MLINPFPFQNSKPTPAGFCKQHTQSVYLYLFKVDQGHNFTARCSTKTLSYWHQAGSKSSLGVNSSSCLQGREQRHSSFIQKRCMGQNRRHHYFLYSQPFTFRYGVSLNPFALTSWDGLNTAPHRKGASYFSYTFLTWGLRLWESGLGWDMHGTRREKEVHILEFKWEVEDE